MTLPSLLVIGAMKCGSTSLHSYLDLHPEIQMSDTKEINFFSIEENYKKGISWYSTFFEEGFKYNGESSVSYSKKHAHSSVVSRIKENLNEDVKLIYIVRDPIDRFQSNFTDSKTYGHIPSSYSINEFVAQPLEDNHLIKTSMYFYQIEDYLRNFDLKNFYFLKADDLKKNPQATMNALFEFLELQTVSIEKLDLNRSATKTYYSTKYLRIAQSPFLQGLKRLIPNKMMASIKSSKALANVSKKKFNPALDIISEQNRVVLKNYLMDDMVKFEELTKIKF